MSDIAGTRGYEIWTRTFDEAWADPGALAKIACPTCSERRINLVYVAEDLDAAAGMFAFWCDACLTGLPPGMGPIPPDAQRVRRGEEDVPNYRLVVE